MTSPPPPASQPEGSPDSSGILRANGEPTGRRASFSFLRPSARRSVSGSMSKKQKKEELARQRQQREAVPPPRLPQLNAFSEDGRPDSISIISNQLGSYMQDDPHDQPAVEPKMPSAPPYNIPIPAIPASSGSRGGGYVDPYAHTESMAHRGRYSYASTAISTISSPRRVRRRKDPTPFNVLVIGTKSAGKTSFINFLRNALAPKKRHQASSSPPVTANYQDSAFTSEYLETEIDHERIGVTLWDSQGLEKSIVDLQLREISSFLESKFEDTFTEEQKVVRAPGVRDTHIHCVFLVLDPVRLDGNISEARKKAVASGKSDIQSHIYGGLDGDLDLQVLRTLQGKTTVIPIISKADTITSAHMAHLKKIVWDSLKQAKLDPLEALGMEEDDEEEEDDVFDENEEDEAVLSADNGESTDKNDAHARNSSDDAHSNLSTSSSSSPPLPPQSPNTRPNHNRRVSAMSATIASAEAGDSEVPYLPLSIISPDIYEPDVVGRKFPWGFADPYNPEHCDFIRLKDSVFSEWRSELREASRERWYEGWRTSRLNRRGGTGAHHAGPAPPNYSIPVERRGD